MRRRQLLPQQPGDARADGGVHFESSRLELAGLMVKVKKIREEKGVRAAIKAARKMATP